MRSRYSCRRIRSCGQFEAFRLFLVQIDRFLRDLDAVTVSTRTEQSTIHDFFQPVHAADGISPS